MYAIGADDLILKPFMPMELFYVALEYAGDKKTTVKMLECGGIRMHPVTGLVTVDGRIVDLPDRLMLILKVLLENKPEAVSRDTILKEVWGNGYTGTERVVDTQIKYLRKLLGQKGKLIQTVKGSGYRMKGI
jgi:DNA-binding response OmpR family regulator